MWGSGGLFSSGVTGVRGHEDGEKTPPSAIIGGGSMGGEKWSLIIARKFANMNWPNHETKIEVVQCHWSNAGPGVSSLKIIGLKSETGKRHRDENKGRRIKNNPARLGFPKRGVSFTGFCLGKEKGLGSKVSEAERAGGH